MVPDHSARIKFRKSDDDIFGTWGTPQGYEKKPFFSKPIKTIWTRRVNGADKEYHYTSSSNSFVTLIAWTTL